MAASAFKKCYILTTFDRIEELSRLNEWTKQVHQTGLN
jgi:hypothetical protein